MAKTRLKRTETSHPLVVGATDDTMAYPVLVWAHSLHVCASQAPHLIIGYFSGLLSENNASLLARALSHLGVSHEFRQLPLDNRFISQGYISPTTFAKFLLADTIAEQHVWIDIDTVATPGWNSIFSFIQNAPQSARLIVAERGDRSPPQEGLPTKPSDLLFNAGVLGWPARPRIPWSAALDTLEVVETQEQYLFNTLYANHLSRMPEAYNTLTYRYVSFRGVTVPYIVHYAGAHKPWHMPRRFTPLSLRAQSPWSLWFEAEKSMLERMASSSDLGHVIDLQQKALRSGFIGTSRDYSGRKVLRLLHQLGPLGWLLVAAARPFARFIPRGTHPLN